MCHLYHLRINTHVLTYTMLFVIARQFVVFPDYRLVKVFAINANVQITIWFHWICHGIGPFGRFRYLYDGSLCFQTVQFFADFLLVFNGSFPHDMFGWRNRRISLDVVFTFKVPNNIKLLGVSFLEVLNCSNACLDVVQFQIGYHLSLVKFWCYVFHIYGVCLQFVTGWVSYQDLLMIC